MTPLREYLQLFKDDISIAAQTTVLNIMKIIEYSKHNMPILDRGLSNENFVGLDFRKCAGMGYILNNTNFESCYINSDFFAQTAWFNGAVDLKFIAMSETTENGQMVINRDKYLAYISEYGDLQIIEYRTGYLVFSKKVGWGFHDNDVIHVANYKDYILVLVYGTDQFNETQTSVIFVFSNSTFKFLKEVPADAVSDDLKEVLNPHMPFWRYPSFVGNKTQPYKCDSISNEYSISFVSGLSVTSDKPNMNAIYQIVDKKSYCVVNNFTFNKYYDNRSIYSDTLFAFYSNDYNDKNRLFVGSLNHGEAIELELPTPEHDIDEVNVTFLKGLMVTFDKRHLISYQTNRPYVSIWTLPSGSYHRILVSEVATYGITALTCTSDSKYIVVSGDNHRVCTYDIDYGNLITTTQDNFSTTSACLLSEHYFATGLNNGLIKIWNLRSQEVCYIFSAHKFEVKEIRCLNANQFMTFSSGRQKHEVNNERERIEGDKHKTDYLYEDVEIKLWNIHITEYSISVTLEKTYFQCDDREGEYGDASKYSQPIRCIGISGSDITALTWSAILVWDITISTPKRIINMSDITQSLEYTHFPNFGLSPDGKQLICSFDSKLVIIDIETMTQKEITNIAISPDYFVISPCGQQIAFEQSCECMIYDFSDLEPVLVKRIETEWDYGTFTMIDPQGFDTPGDKAFLKSIDFLQYFDGGNKLAISSREGIIYIYNAINYSLIDIKCMRGSINAIDSIEGTKKIVACDGQSLYIWDDIDYSVSLLPNINGGYVECCLKGLKTDDIQSSFLWTLCINGCDVKDNATRESASNVPLERTSTLISNTYSDFSDAIQVFTLSEKLSYEMCRKACRYLESLNRLDFSNQTLIPLTFMDSLGHLAEKHENSFTTTDWLSFLKEIYYVYKKSPNIKSRKSNGGTALLVAKYMLKVASNIKGDEGYNTIFKEYARDFIFSMPKNSEAISTLSHALTEVVNKLEDYRKVSDICEFFRVMIYNKEYSDSLIAYSYASILFNLIKIQPQRERFNTLDEIFRVYSENKYVQEGYAYLYARACDHFAYDYIFDHEHLYYFDLIVEDLKNISSVYPDNLDVLFSLATYQIAQIGSKDFAAYTSKPSFAAIKMLIAGRKNNNKNPATIRDIITENESLAPLRMTIYRMQEAYSKLTESYKEAAKIDLKMQRIHDLLNVFYTFMR